MKDINYRFTNTPLEPSDEEILAHKDFSKVYNEIKDPGSNAGLLKGGALLGILIGALYFMFPIAKEPLAPVTYEIETSFNVPEQEVVETLDISEIEVFEEALQIDQQELIASKRQPAKVIQQTAPIEESKQPDSHASQLGVFKAAEPSIGYDSLYQFLAKNLVYPSTEGDSLEGKVEVQFTIGSSGQVSNILVVESLGPAFDTEAVRLISSMPAWKPAYANNLAIATKKQISIIFKKK